MKPSKIEMLVIVCDELDKFNSRPKRFWRFITFQHNTHELWIERFRQVLIENEWTEKEYMDQMFEFE